MLKNFLKLVKKESIINHIELHSEDLHDMDTNAMSKVYADVVDEISILGHNKDQSQVLKEIEENIRKRYKKAIATKDIALFHKEALNLIVENVRKTEFGKHEKFVKEMSYFAHYLFMMLQDDFFIGNKRLKNRMTKLDNYIFSQYRKEVELKDNINKIVALSFSARFLDEPRANLLSYFVFLEENGIELIILLEDFYKMLENTQSKSWFTKFTNSKSKRLHKSYAKEDRKEILKVSEQTFISVEPSLNDNIQEYRKNIYNDDLKFFNKEQNLD